MKVAAGACVAILLAVAALAVPYRRLARRVDQQLAGSLLHSVDYYSAPEMSLPVIPCPQPISPTR